MLCTYWFLIYDQRHLEFRFWAGTTPFLGELMMFSQTSESDRGGGGIPPPHSPLLTSREWPGRLVLLLIISIHFLD